LHNGRAIIQTGLLPFWWQYFLGSPNVGSNGALDGQFLASQTAIFAICTVLGDDELQSQSAVDAHIFPMLVQTVFEHIKLLTDVASTTS